MNLLLNKTHRIFISKSLSAPPSPDLLLLLREALSRLFPNALPVENLGGNLSAPPGFFLQEEKNLLWVELVSVPFFRNNTSDYLEKARQIQMAFPSGVSGVLAAPEFEVGVRELLEWVRIPLRIFRYREALSLDGEGSLRDPFHESVLWMEELTAEKKEEKEEKITESLPEESPPLPNRLSREELREFIQFELDVAFPSL